MQKTSDRNPVEQEASGEDRCKQCILGFLYLVSDEKMIDKLHIFSCLWWSRRQGLGGGQAVQHVWQVGWGGGVGAGTSVGKLGQPSCVPYM
jgi:hypothetical protein